jgi:hypothetical protein
MERSPPINPAQMNWEGQTESESFIEIAKTLGNCVATLAVREPRL